TEKSGELVDIALQAMATDPAARYQSVKEFQDALRDYQSHAESIVLSNRAEDDLAQATAEKKYELFARALFGYEEAASLWSGNAAAQKGTIEARRAYAEAALDKNDFELGLSLIDPNQREHTLVARRLDAGQAEQRARTRRLAMLKRVAFGLVLALFAGGTLALLEINDKRATAEARQRDAETARGVALEEKQKAEVARGEALVEKQRADDAREDVEKERDRATLALIEEAKARSAAQSARKREQRETYVAQMGLAAERIDANAFDQAAALLENYHGSPLANWEWGRLSYVCRPHRSMHDAGDTVKAVRELDDGRHFVVATESGRIEVWQYGSAPERVAEFSLPEPIGACALARDLRHIAVAPRDTAAIRIYEVAADAGVPTAIVGERPAQVLTGHTGTVNSLEYSPEGTLLLSGSQDHTARLWDTATAATVRVFQGHSWSVWQATFSPVAADQVIATAGQDGRVIVWSVADGAQVTDFNEHQGPVRAVAFSTDGRLVATAGDDRRVLVWDWRQTPALDLQQLIAQGTRPAVSYAELTGHRAAVNCLRFSHKDARRLVSGSDDNSLIVWQLSGDPGAGELLVPMRGHSRRITTCGFAGDGLHLLSGSEDHQWGLWDITGFREVNQLQSLALRGHENGILAARFSPDGRQVATASLDRTARLWNAAGGTEERTLREGHEFLATTVIARQDGQLLTSAGDNTTRLWDLATGAQTGVLNGTGRHGALAVAADGRHVLTGAVPLESPAAAGGSVTRTYALLWDLQSQKVVREYSETIEQRLATAAPLASVTSAAISPDGAVIFTGHSDGQGRVWRGDADQPLLLQGHTRSVTAAAFVPTDPNRLLTASGDQTVAQWDLAAGRELPDLALHHQGWVTSLTVSDDGQSAVTASEDGFVRLWEISTAHELARLDGSGEIVHGLAFSNDGRTLLWTGDDGVVRLSDVSGELDERTIDAVAGGWVYSVATSPDGRLLALVDERGDVSVVELATGRVQRRFDGAQSRVAAFTTTGGGVVGAGIDGRLRLFDVSGESPPREWPAHEGAIRDVAVAPSGDWLASAGDDGVIRMWDVRGEEARELRSMSGHSGSVTRLAIAADGSFLASGDEDGTLRLWTAEGTSIATIAAHPGGVRAIAVSPDSRWIVTGGADRRLCVWERGSQSPVSELEAHEGVIRSLAFSPDGLTLSSLAADRAVRLWQTNDWKWSGEIAKGRGMSAHPVAAASSDLSTIAVGNSGERVFRVHQSEPGQPGVLNEKSQLRADAGVVWSAALLPDNSSLVTIGGDATRVWDFATRNNVLTMRPQGVVSAVAYSPDGARLITGSWDHSARIWDTATGRVIRQLTGGHLGSVTQVACLPDGVHVITAGDDGAIRLWNAETGELEQTPIQESGAAVLGLALSQDGHVAATVSTDNVLRIWDLQDRRLLDSWKADDIGSGPLLSCALSPQGAHVALGTTQGALLLVRGQGAPVHRLTGHTAGVLAVAFSPDGKRLMTGSEDFTAKLWDVASGKEMLSLGRHTGAVTAVGFSQDGRAALTAGRDGLAIVWPSDEVQPSILTTRDRLEYEDVGSIAVLDEGLEVNAPTFVSGGGLQVVLELRSAPGSEVGLGKLCMAHGENSAVTVAGNDVAVEDGNGSAVPAAQLVWSGDARRLEIVFAPTVDLSIANAVLRRVAYRVDRDQSSIAATEAQFETVTFRIIQAENGTQPPVQELPAIEIQVMPAGDLAGSANADVATR
ncbi:MAG: hypothetical protein JNG89_03410, partial [Planctomycetaceae bacterium]|nr:hypothetical protein [Planctomycetaceae bacterium]